MGKITTLTEFITDQQALNPGAKGDLSRLLNDIAIASKIVHREINKAGLVDILGDVGQENIQGEPVKKLDIYANNQFIAALNLAENVPLLLPKKMRILSFLMVPTQKTENTL